MSLCWRHSPAVGLLAAFLATPSPAQTSKENVSPLGDGASLVASLPGPAGGLELRTPIPAPRPALRPVLRPVSKALKLEPVEPASEAPPERILARGRHTLVVPPPKSSPLYERTFQRLLSQPEKTDRYDEFIIKYAELHKLDPRVMKALIAAESEFDNSSRSPMGARGLMQVLPRTAETFGVPGDQLGDPEQNIKAGSAYLAYLFARAFKEYRLKGVPYADVPLWVLQRVIAAYNEGPQALHRRTWFRQTRHYVWKVLLYRRSSVTDLRRPLKRRQGLPEVESARSSVPFF